MAVVPDAGEPDAGEPLSPQAADLVRRIAWVILDEPADLMDQFRTGQDRITLFEVDEEEPRHREE